ncbi:MAG: iron donor protein CyaY [Candidatus Accumulibacter sp.]|jgi:CyaY protein|nr:iron donor protein CyaY [Accumulibacter sp.]
MRDSEFIGLADRALANIEQGLDAAGVDLDCAMTGDGVLEIEFADGGRIVVNRQAAAQEIWLAGRAGGFHFRWDEGAWRGTKDGRELMAVLSEWLSKQTGERIDLG